MKKLFLYTIINLLVGMAQVAAATPITVDFANGTSSNGQYTVDVIVSNLSVGGAVAAYNLDLLYNASRLAATDVQFGSGLGDVWADTPTARQGSVLSSGLIDFWSISLLNDVQLLAYQNPDFMDNGTLLLATLVFTDTGFGSTGLAFDWYKGKDVKGLNNEIIAGYVPEPATFLLLGSGLAAFGAFRRRSKTRKNLLIVLLAGALSFVLANTTNAAPFINAISPSSGTVNVPLSTTITATFSETMDATTLNGATVMLAQFIGINSLAAGFAHTLALKNDGTVVAWGNNSFNQATVPTGLNGVIAIAAGESHSVALKGDGTVVAWGDNTFNQAAIPNGLSGVVAISAGFGHTLALKNDGSVISWGLNTSGQVTLPSGLSAVKAISAGSYHSMALNGDGSIIVWGNNDYGQTVVPPEAGIIKAIAAGWNHCVAVREDGSVIAWGNSYDGQTKVPAGLAAVTTVAAGGYHSVALKSDGNVVAWGYNGYGQTNVPGDLTGVSHIYAGSYYSAAVKTDGTATAWGRNNYGQSVVQGSICLGTPIPGTVSYESGSSVVSFVPTSQLPYSTTLTALVSTGAKSLAGAYLSKDIFWYFTTDVPRYLLTVTIGGTGGGSVIGGGIACIDGSTQGCSATYPGGSRVDLNAVANWKSKLVTWGGDCSGSTPDGCSPVLSQNRTVIATFNLNSQTIVDGNPLNNFATLQEAYQAAGGGGVITAQATTFYENLLLAETKSVTLDGGKDVNGTTVGSTTIHGALTIAVGTCIIANFIIE